MPRNAPGVCRFFLNGHCRHGNRCRFQHVLPQDYYEEEAYYDNEGGDSAYDDGYSDPYQVYDGPRQQSQANNNRYNNEYHDRDYDYQPAPSNRGFGRPSVDANRYRWVNTSVPPPPLRQQQQSNRYENTVNRQSAGGQRYNYQAASGGAKKVGNYTSPMRQRNSEESAAMDASSSQPVTVHSRLGPRTPEPKRRSNSGGARDAHHWSRAESPMLQSRMTSPGLPPTAGNANRQFGKETLTPSKSDPPAEDYVDTILYDMLQWESTGQWKLSSYGWGMYKKSIFGFPDISQEELRMMFYEAKAQGGVNKLNDVVSRFAISYSHLREQLKTITRNEKTALIDLITYMLQNPNQTSSFHTIAHKHGLDRFRFSTESVAVASVGHPYFRQLISKPPSPGAVPSSLDLSGFSFKLNTSATASNERTSSTAISTGGIYSKMNELSGDNVAAFRADKFELGKVPRVPPPKELC